MAAPTAIRSCVISSGFALLACAGREAAWQQGGGGTESVSQVSRSEAASLTRRADELWKKRLGRTALTGCIDLLSRAASLDPSDPARLAWLARAYYFLADGHLTRELERAKEADESGESKATETAKSRVRSVYRSGVEAAERAIAAHAPRFAHAMRSGARLETALSLIEDAAAAGALFWYAANLSRWALLMGLPEILYHKDRVFAVVKRVEALAPNFFYGATDRYFGVYYTRVPVPRGDLPRSRSHFERAVRRHPHYLASRVLFAEHYAVRARDRALFERELRAVVAADENAITEVVPELTLEKRRARRLLDRVEDFF